jgi:hypothetical protein
MRSAMMRASVSVVPPAANGTTSDSGFAGQACAPAGSVQAQQQISKTIRTT